MREKNYDILRTVSCIAIIILHVSAWTFGNHGNGIDDGVILFCNSFTRFAVPSFIMLTGAFTLHNPTNCKALTYYKKVLKKVVVPTLIVSAFCVLYCEGMLFLREIVFHEVVDYWHPLKMWLAGDPFGHMWYMYMLIGFYIAAPFLCRIIQKISLPAEFALSIVLLVWGIYSAFLSEPVWPLKFTQYLGYFVLGDVIRSFFRNKEKKAVAVISGIFFAILSVLSVYVYYCSALEYSNWFTQLNYHERLSPVVIGASLSLFVMIANIKCKSNNRFIEIISEHSFYVYLFHGIIIAVINNIWIELLGIELITPLITVPVYSCFVLFVSLVLSVGSHRLELIIKKYKNRHKNQIGNENFG